MSEHPSGNASEGASGNPPASTPESSPENQPQAEPAAASIPPVAEHTAPTPTPAADYSAPPAPAAPAPKRRFPWVPVLAAVVVLQLIGSGVLAVVLIATASQVVELNDTVAAHEDTIAEQQAEIAEQETELDLTRDDLDVLEIQLDVALEHATAYERCLIPVFESIDAWVEGDEALSEQIDADAWGLGGPCTAVASYLFDE